MLFDEEEIKILQGQGFGGREFAVWAASGSAFGELAALCDVKTSDAFDAGRNRLFDRLVFGYVDREAEGVLIDPADNHQARANIVAVSLVDCGLDLLDLIFEPGLQRCVLSGIDFGAQVVETSVQELLQALHGRIGESARWHAAPPMFRSSINIRLIVVLGNKKLTFSAD